MEDKDKINQDNIIKIAKRVFEHIGPGHNERIYHKAMNYELSCQNYLFDTEMNLIVNYTDTKGNTHFLESERIDIYLHEINVILELKAIQRDIQAQEICQLKKYFRELGKIGKNINYGLIINFRQPNAKDIPSEIDFQIIKNE